MALGIIHKGIFFIILLFVNEKIVNAGLSFAQSMNWGSSTTFSKRNVFCILQSNGSNKEK